jgi:hypothetical protein
MPGLRNIFTLYAVSAAGLAFFMLMHLMPLLTASPAVFIGDRLPEHIAIVSQAPIERHSPGVQNSHTLVKPAN